MSSFQELVINPEFIVDSHTFDILPGKLGRSTLCCLSVTFFFFYMYADWHPNLELFSNPSFHW